MSGDVDKLKAPIKLKGFPNKYGLHHEIPTVSSTERVYVGHELNALGEPTGNRHFLTDMK